MREGNETALREADGQCEGWIRKGREERTNGWVAIGGAGKPGVDGGDFPRLRRFPPLKNSGKGTEMGQEGEGAPWLTG